jgi:hypothetical protein
MTRQADVQLQRSIVLTVVSDAAYPTSWVRDAKDQYEILKAEVDRLIEIVEEVTEQRCRLAKPGKAHYAAGVITQFSSLIDG